MSTSDEIQTIPEDDNSKIAFTGEREEEDVKPKGFAFDSSTSSSGDDEPSVEKEDSLYKIMYSAAKVDPILPVDEMKAVNNIDLQEEVKINYDQFRELVVRPHRYITHAAFLKSLTPDQYASMLDDEKGVRNNPVYSSEPAVVIPSVIERLIKRWDTYGSGYMYYAGKSDKLLKVGDKKLYEFYSAGLAIEGSQLRPDEMGRIYVVNSEGQTSTPSIDSLHEALKAYIATLKRKTKYDTESASYFMNGAYIVTGVIQSTGKKYQKLGRMCESFFSHSLNATYAAYVRNKAKNPKTQVARMAAAFSDSPLPIKGVLTEKFWEFADNVFASDFGVDKHLKANINGRSKKIKISAIELVKFISCFTLLPKGIIPKYRRFVTFASKFIEHGIRVYTQNSKLSDSLLKSGVSVSMNLQVPRLKEELDGIHLIDVTRVVDKNWLRGVFSLVRPFMDIGISPLILFKLSNFNSLATDGFKFTTSMLVDPRTQTYVTCLQAAANIIEPGGFGSSRQFMRMVRAWYKIGKSTAKLFSTALRSPDGFALANADPIPGKFDPDIPAATEKIDSAVDNLSDLALLENGIDVEYKVRDVLGLLN